MPEWGNLVGKTAEEATQQIKADSPEANVVILPEGSPVTRDYNPFRVRVFVNGDNVVTSPPHAG